MKAESKSTGSTVAATQTETAPPPAPSFEKDREQVFRENAATFQIGIGDDGDTVVWAANDQAFRAGMTVVALNRAVGLLVMARDNGIARLLAENQAFHAGGLEDAFNRAIHLLEYGRYLNGGTSIHDCADEIIGREWLIGKLDEQGRVVAH